ncbi:MAG: hypothetical protein ACYCS7_11855 [Acidimicrobiales bacterium]
MKPLSKHPAPTTASSVLALAGAVLMLVIAVVHLHLWASQGYRRIPKIGPLFLANVIIGLVVAFLLVLTVVPGVSKVPVLGRSWGQVLLGLGGALFAVGTLVGYIITLTHGLFQFKEPGVSYAGGVAIFAEVVGAAVLVAWAARARTA